MGGTTTAGALPQLPLLLRNEANGRAPDAVLIDFSLNDQSCPQDWVTTERSQPSARVEPSASTRGGFAWAREWARQSTPSAREEISAATESMLRYLLSALPSTALAMVEGSCTSVSSREQHEMVAMHYGVPFFAYSDVLRGTAGCDAVAWAGGDVHPTFQTHSYIAAALEAWMHGLRRQVTKNTELRARGPPPASGRTGMLQAASPPPAPPLPTPLLPELSRRFEVCAQQLSVYDAKSALVHGAPLPGVRVTTGNWTLVEERGKAGWLSTGPAGSTIEWDVRFGRSPRLSLVYERSYEGFGRARLSLRGVSKLWDAALNRSVRATHVIRATPPAGNPRVTQTELLTLNVQQRHVQSDELGIHGFGVSPQSSHTVQLTMLDDAKFKVRFVASC